MKARGRKEKVRRKWEKRTNEEGRKKKDGGREENETRSQRGKRKTED